MERFVDASTVAEHVGITRRAVLEMTRRGVFPGYPLGMGSRRKTWKYKLSEVDAAIVSCRTKLRKASSAETPSRVQLHPAVPGANGGDSNG